MLKKIAVLAMALTIGVSVSALACEGGKGRPSNEERLSRMQQHLNLSEEQVAEIRTIHENGGGRREIGAVLTEEQRQTMREHHKRKQEMKQERKQQKSAEPTEAAE